MSIALNASLRRASVAVFCALFTITLLAGSASLGKEGKEKPEKAAEAEKAKPEGVALVVIADEAALLTVVNKADAKTLTRLPGIGKKTAQKVIEARPFKKLDDLTKVKGIAEKRLAKIKSSVGKIMVPENLFAAAAE
jgi:DNA uptake protein ComE-like DNA-binding protein